MRYFDGVISFQVPDLDSGGFGASWTQARSWTNRPGYSADSVNGYGVVDAGMPHLADVGSGSIAVVSNGQTARFFDLSSGTYVERFYGKDNLTYDATAGEYTLTEFTGHSLRFDDFATGVPAAQHGQLLSDTDAAGHVTTVSRATDGTVSEVQRSDTTGSATITESFLYAYLPTGNANEGRLTSVTLRRRVGTGSWSTVREADYAYYDGVESHGNLGDLKTVIIRDSASTALDTSYYRYYVASEANGYVHGLKYAVQPQSFARLAAAFTDPFAASDPDLAPYADNYFEYDSSQRVTKEVAQGDGCSVCSAGLGTYEFTYTVRSDTVAGVNKWKVKTVETLPDGNQNVVYTNYYGEVMLKVFREVTTGREWPIFHQYDAQGREVLTADPSAVSGYDETYADLLHWEVAGAGGQETALNQTPAGDQTAPAIAVNADGYSVAVWIGPDASGTGIFARLINPDGTTNGDEFRVNTITSGDQVSPAVAVAPDGTFTITWETPDGWNNGIVARRYHANGTAYGTVEFPVSTTTYGPQWEPKVGYASNGSFVIVWSNVYQGEAAAQLYAADGTPDSSGELSLGGTSGDWLVSTRLTVAPDGSFVAGWLATDWSTHANYTVRTFAANAAATSNEEVAHSGFGVEAWDMSRGEGGEILAAWTAGDWHGFGVYARVRAANGTWGAPGLVPELQFGNQEFQSLAPLPGGGWAVAWQDLVYEGSGYGLFARRLAADGTPVGDQFPVNRTTAGNQDQVRLAAAPGGFAVAWRSDGQDGDGFGVYTRRFGAGYEYLLDLDGLITRSRYATATTATETAVGDVAGKLQYTAIQRGETGTASIQELTHYVQRTAGGVTVWPEALSTVFRDPAASTAAGRLAQSTYTAYTWYTDTTQPQTVTVYAPGVSDAQNGGYQSAATTAFDRYGRPVWTKNAEGFLTYTEYDPRTGAATKTITDVDTTQTADFTGLPTDWSTPTGGGLHLKTLMEVDSLGRPTKITSPNGIVRYTVYKDDGREVRSYTWDPATHLPVGPVAMQREDRSRKYSESLTFTVPSTYTWGTTPDGTEPIGTVRTLSRQIVNDAGQVVASDQYFNLDGVTYSPTTATLGTQWSRDNPTAGNYYRTEYAYDDRGRLRREKAPTGTITRTVYDGPGRAVSTWVGTDDGSGFGWASGTVYASDAGSGPDLSRDVNYTTDATFVANLPNGSYVVTVTLGDPSAARDQMGVYLEGSLVGTVSTAAGQTDTHSYSVTVSDRQLTLRLRDLGGSDPYASIAGLRISTAEGDCPVAGKFDFGRTSSPAAAGYAPITPSTTYTGTSSVNLVKVTANEYDGGGVGDGNLTKATQFPGGGADARVEAYAYDWRDRLIATKSGVQATESTSLNRPVTYTQYDFLGNVVASEQYDGDGVTITADANDDGVPDRPSDGLLRAKVTMDVDNLGRAFRTHTFSVDPATGGVSSTSLTSDTWYDLRGNVIKTAAPGGLVSKATYDGAGRVVKTFTTDGGGDTSYADARNVTGDAVLEQTETQYDKDGNVIQVTTRQRRDDFTGTGDLADKRVYSPMANGGFESPVMSTTPFYVYGPSGATWSFSAGDTGISANGTGFTGTQTAPQGSQVAFLQKSGSISQSVSLSAGTYALTFKAAQRANFGGAQRIEVLLNTDIIGTFTPTTSYADFTATFVIETAGSYTLKLRGTSYPVDNTAFVDDIQIGSAAARTSYSAAYYDAADRLIATVNVGTNAGAAWTRPSSVPTRSDTVLVTSHTYDEAGRLFSVVDPRATESRTYYDALGRVVASIENYDDGTVSADNDKSTTHAYVGPDLLGTLTLWLPGGDLQRTQYIYGVSTTTIASNELLAAIYHPDKSTGEASSSEADTYTYNALGERIGLTDRNGTAHAYSFDVLGRPTADAVTLASGGSVDGAVLRLETAYDTQGNPYLFTSYSATSGGDPVNQVLRQFNGLGQLTAEYQAHSGPVALATTPAVTYAYSNLAGGANHSRLTAMTYPDGFTVGYQYGSGLDNTISRLSSLTNGSTTLEGYTYLGLGTVVARTHPESGVDLTYVSGTTGDAGDQYAGLDRFGRVVDQRWVDGSGADVDRFQYGYDRESNRTFKADLVTGANSEVYAYDGLNQLTGFQRGVLNSTNDGIDGTVYRSQGWTIDGAGNFDTVTTDGTGETRKHNAQNQATSVGSANLTFDANGNTTVDDHGQALTYDAWNRLVAAGDSTYTYDALSRRISEGGKNGRDLFVSESDQVVDELASGDWADRQVWSPVYVDALVLRDRDANTSGSDGLEERLYVTQDGNWNVTGLVDATGSVQERYMEDPYGKVSVLNPDSTPRGSSNFDWVYFHQGGRFDEAAGLYHFRGRDLSPTLMRWLNEDPLAFSAGDANLYKYAAADPVGELDPSGLAPTVTIKPLGPAQGGRGGSYAWEVNFQLDAPAAKDKGGWIIQRLDLDYTAWVKGEDTKKKPPRKHVVRQASREIDYYFEGWYVSPNAIIPAEKAGALKQRFEFGPDYTEPFSKQYGIDLPKESWNDSYRLPDVRKQPDGELCRFTITLKGQLYFFNGVDVETLEKTYLFSPRVKGAGKLYGLSGARKGKFYQLLENVKDHSGPVAHTLEATWDATENEGITQLKTTP